MHKLRVISLSLIIFIASIQPGLVHAQSVSANKYYCPDPALSSDLKYGTGKGSPSVQVKELQKFIASYYDLDAEEFATGFFGRITQGYVKKFQMAQNINSSGFVGGITRGVIQSVCVTSKPISQSDVFGDSARQNSASTSTATTATTTAAGSSVILAQIVDDNGKVIGQLGGISFNIKYSGPGGSGDNYPITVPFGQDGSVAPGSYTIAYAGGAPAGYTYYGYTDINGNNVADHSPILNYDPVTKSISAGNMTAWIFNFKKTVASTSYMPTCNLAADPSTIKYGESSRLHVGWMYTESFSIDHGIGVIATSVPALFDGVKVTPSVTTTYTGNAFGFGNGPATCSATVSVTDVPQQTAQNATTTTATTTALQNLYTHYTTGAWSTCAYSISAASYSQTRTVTTYTNTTAPNESAPATSQTCTANGTLRIRATLNGNQISAGNIAIDYTSPVQSGTGYTVQVGDNLTRPAGNYTINYSSGNTAGTGIVFSNITPGSNQTLSPGSEITYTFNFSCAAGYSYNSGSCVATAAQSTAATTTATATTQTTTPIPGSCAAAKNTCSNGTTVGVNSSEDKTTYYWQCNGLNGGGNTSCSAHKPNGNLMFQAKVNGVPVTVPWKSAVDITLNGTYRGTYQVDGSGTVFANGVYNYQNNETGNYSIVYSAGNTLGAGYTFKGISTPEDTQISGSKSGNLNDGGTLMFILNFTGPTSMIDGGRALANVVTAVQDSNPQLVNTVNATNLKYTWSNDLQIGSPYTTDVSALQNALAHEGMYSGKITGGFYSQTFTAVKDFQEKYGIKATGYVGYATRQKLNSLYSK